MSASGSQDKPAPAGPALRAGDIHLLVNEVELLLAEKRTALSLMQTGLSLFVLPLSICSVLIATSRYYDAAQVLHLFVPVMVLNAALVAFAVYLVALALKKLRALDRKIAELKGRSPDISRLVT